MYVAMRDTASVRVDPVTLMMRFTSYSLDNVCGMFICAFSRRVM